MAMRFSESIFTLTENDIAVIATQNLAGLLNLESLNMSKNRLGDESFGPNSLPVSFFSPFIGPCMTMLLLWVQPNVTCVEVEKRQEGLKCRASL